MSARFYGMGKDNRAIAKAMVELVKAGDAYNDAEIRFGYSTIYVDAVQAGATVSILQSEMAKALEEVRK